MRTRGLKLQVTGLYRRGNPVAGFVAALALALGLSGLGLLATGQIATGQAQGLKVTWNLPNPPTEGRVGLRILLSNLELANSGTQPWPKDGPNQLRLAYRWFEADNKPLDPKNKDRGYDELRADLPQPIPPGGRVLYPQFLVATPNAPGDYTLHIDLVQGPNADIWLAGRGSPDLSLKVSIKPRDTTPPTSRVRSLPLFSNSTFFTVSWEGQDDKDGTGLASYDLQYKVSGDNDWRDWLLNSPATSAQFTGENGKLYLFRSRATDRAGNAGKYPDTEQASTRVDSLPPSARVETLPALGPEVFLVRWSSFDNVSGTAAALVDVQYREGSSGTWTDWQLGSSTGSALFRGENGKTYSFRARATDYAGNQGDFGPEPQASLKVNASFNTLFTLPLSQPVSNTQVVSPTSAVQAQSAFFPLAVKSGENGTGTSDILVYNPGPAPIDVFVRFNERAGAPISTTVNNQLQPVSADQAAGLARVETILKTVEPGATINVWAGVVLPASYNGWVEVRSAGAFEASAVRQPASSLPVQYAAAQSGRQLYLPYVRKSDLLSSSYINLANPNSTPAEFTITYYDAASGNVLSTDKRSLPRYGSTRISSAGVGTVDPNLRFTGSAIISSSVALAGSVELTLDDGSPLSYPALVNAAPVAPQTPVYREADGVTTSLLVQNTTRDATPVKLEYLDSNGQVVASKEQTLAGFARLNAWQGDVKELSPGFSGKVRVSTSSASGALAVTVLGAGPGFKSRQFL